jgi:hypothetical protein
MNSRQIGILSAIALLALPLVGRASVPLVTKTFASSSLAGSSAPFSPGSSKICSVLFTSSGDATVTIRGQPIRGMASIQPIQASARTEPSQIRGTNSVWTGDVSHFPGEFMLSWAGNSSTISGSVTCFGQAEPALLGAEASTNSTLPIISAHPADPPSYFPLATSTPFLVTNSGTPSGTGAPWAFEATSSSCGSSDSNLLMKWANNTFSPTTPGTAYLSCNGNLNITGAYTGSGSGLTGILYSALPYAPVPIATSTPLLITNSESPIVTGEAPYIFQATAPSCGDTGDSDLVDFWNNGDEPVLRIACSTTSGTVLNGIIVGGDLTTKGVVNDGLPTPEPSPAPPYEPICGAHDLFEQWCQGYVAPTYTTSGAAASSTFHCVYGSAVAIGGATTIPLTNAAAFATGPVEVDGVNATTATVLATTSFTSVGASSVTFTTTSGDSYYFHFCGF